MRGREPRSRFPDCARFVEFTPPIRKDIIAYLLKNYPYSASPQDYIEDTSEPPTRHFIRMHPNPREVRAKKSPLPLQSLMLPLGPLLLAHDGLIEIREDFIQHAAEHTATLTMEPDLHEVCTRHAMTPERVNGRSNGKNARISAATDACSAATGARSAEANVRSAATNARSAATNARNATYRQVQEELAKKEFVDIKTSYASIGLESINCLSVNLGSHIPLVTCFVSLRSEGDSVSSKQAAGITNMMLEVQMQDFENDENSYLYIQYVLFPPHFMPNAILECDSGTEDDTEEDIYRSIYTWRKRPTKKKRE
ncbi:hypothetical protein G5I_01883 [Acromyrmex echinatior]|uniref:Uncharacterized protein n=1 Tax=Acromyrmex echinatior TaxID=103372 RepID=F4W8U6_ACREC|nr:hypothetical protein G5I_01883 [Acromyrmex echinatior]